MSDKTTVMAYLKKKGDMVSQDLYWLTQENVAWSELRMIPSQPGTFQGRTLFWQIS